tara:strand:+ start:415 stop:1401 length:987 start_codon:yes stop_codon:yes gene_type:complete
MIGTYGIAKIGVASITDANVQYLRDTDLGLPFRGTKSENEVPAKGTAATFSTVSTGYGYTIGKSKTLIQNATDGTGTGLKVITDIVEDDGILVVGSELQPTAIFNQFQNDLLLAFDGENPDPYTYTRITATGQAFTGVSNAIPGTSATGTAGTFIVTVTSGSVTKVTVAAGGTVYKVGDVVTITKAVLELNGSFGGGNVFQSDLELLVTEDNVLGRIAEFDGITLLSGGEGHAIGDVITLSEEGSTVVGTGALTVATLGGALNTPGEITKYPTGIINTGTAGAISVKDVAGNTVVLGAMQPGIVRKFSFSQVMGAGTGPAVGEVTILY